MSADIPKLKAAIAYLCQPGGVGKVKLFKFLYFSDFSAYVRLGRAITWETYEHFAMGPVPKTLWHNFDSITKDCVNISAVDVGMPRPEQHMRTKRGASLAALNVDDKTILENILKKYGPLTVAQLRDLAHKDIPYRATSTGDDIPYTLALYVGHKRPTEEEVRRITQRRNDVTDSA